jgi:hypothetical protein
MTRILKYNFPSVNNTISAVCALQDVAGPGNLLLNGAFVEPVTGVMSFKNRGYSRSVSFTSGNDLSGANFSIVGMENGVVVTENAIVGPDNETVFSNKTYDTITSITVDQAVIGIQVGGGRLGYFGPLGGSAGATGFPVWGVSVVPIAIPFVGRVQYSVYGSLDNTGNTSSYQDLITKKILLDYGEGNNPFTAPTHTSAFSPSNLLVIEIVIDDGGAGADFKNDEFTFNYYDPRP